VSVATRRTASWVRDAVARRRSLVGGRRLLHRQLSNVLVGLEEDDVKLWNEETEQCHGCTQADRDAQSRYLHLQRSAGTIRGGIRDQDYSGDTPPPGPVL